MIGVVQHGIIIAEMKTVMR